MLRTHLHSVSWERPLWDTIDTMEGLSEGKTRHLKISEECERIVVNRWQLATVMLAVLGYL